MDGRSRSWCARRCIGYAGKCGRHLRRRLQKKKEAPAYIPPPFWTGFYFGGHIGAAWENISFNCHEYDDFSDELEFWRSWGHNPGYLGGNNTSRADAFGGVQFGYNSNPQRLRLRHRSRPRRHEPQHQEGTTHPIRRRHNPGAWTGTKGEVGGIQQTLDGESQGGFYGDGPACWAAPGHLR